MFLDNVTRKLQVVLTTAKTTLDMPILVDWVDMTANTTTAGLTPSVSNGITLVDILPAPAASTQRKVNGITIYNKDTAAKTLQVILNDNGTSYVIVDVTIQIDDTLGYTDTGGWYIQDLNGARKTAQGQSDAQLATLIHAASSKTTPVDADELPLADSATSFNLKKLTLANLKATLIASVASLNGGQLAGFRNRIINGGMQVSQRGSVAAALNTYTYGGCDRISVNPSGFATASGTIAQASGIGVGSNDVCQSVNLTTTGSGNVIFSTRLEAADTTSLNSKTVTISAHLIHNSTGQSYPITVQILKANSVDNFSATTSIVTSGTLLTLANGIDGFSSYSYTFGAADCSNGIEIRVSYNGVGAVTGKIFYLTDLQLEVGSNATPFEQIPYILDLALCQRYYYRTGSSASIGIGVGVSSSTTQCKILTSFPVTMRTNVTAVEQSGTVADYSIYTGSGSIVCATTVPSFNVGSANTAETVFTTGATQTVGYACIGRGSVAGYLGWSAEL